MSAELEKSYQLCHQIARKTGKNFFYSFLVMPREKRDAMCAIYAFMRRSDDIADGAASPAAALQNLRQWRATVDSAFRGENSNEPILPAVVDTVQRYRISHRYFHDLLDGAEMDQTTRRYETFSDLYKYCYRVASAVGLIVLPIFGFEDESALGPAESCGIAFQLTNILRDVREDAEMGRIYVPLEDLRKFGVQENDIMRGRATPEFVQLMKFEAGRAREYYEKAKPLLDMVSLDSRGTLAVMIGIYGGILRKIERSNFAVFGSKIRLSMAEKLWIVLKNWMQYRL